MLPFLPLISDLSGLTKPIAAIERRLAPGTMSVTIWDLQTGDRWGYRERDSYPMQSSFKFPLGVAFLHEVDRGRMSLTKRLRIGRKDLSVPSSQVNERVLRDGTLSISNRELLELAVGTSDNTATDLLMKQLGGPKRVTQILRSMGVREIRVDRYEHQLQMEYAGGPAFTIEMATDAGIDAAIEKVPRATRQRALSRYLRDPRDTCTSESMASLLKRLDEGNLLSPLSTKFLTDVMTASQTGPDRLRVAIPEGATLCHKTGTSPETFGIRGTMVDAGLIRLKDGRKVIVVAMLKGVGGTYAQQERAIADVARLAIRAISQ